MPETATTTDYRRYLEPRTLAKVASLDLRARLVIEGLMTGMHRSPYQGISVEFAQHRQYVPGDDSVVIWPTPATFYTGGDVHGKASRPTSSHARSSERRRSPARRQLFSGETCGDPVITMTNMLRPTAAQQ